MAQTRLFHRRLLSDEIIFPAPTTTTVNQTRSSYINDSSSSFDTNMVIILAALLCALICALGLNSIVRCAVRCGCEIGRRNSPENPSPAAARKGLKKSRLRRIPVEVYGSGEGVLPETATECPICLGEFEDGEKVRVLPPCNHGFHIRCIDTWLLSHSSCPNCRRSLSGPDLEAGPPDGPTGLQAS